MRQWMRWILPVILGLGLAAVAHAQPARQVQPLEQGWRFIRQDVPDGGALALDDSGWQKVSLPHSFNANDGADPRYYRGAAWYRRVITLPKSGADKHTWIEFDGAALAADVWLNGTKIGRHEGGFARFRFDLTPRLKAGRNVLAVRVDNSRLADVAPLGGDFTLFGGLYRGVRLVTTRDVHLDMMDYGGPGVAFRASNITSQGAALHWTARVANDRDMPVTGKVVIRLTDAGHHVVATASQPVTMAAHSMSDVALDAALDHPHLWQGVADPYLYDSEVEVVTGGTVQDRIVIPVGLRDIRLDPDKGLLLNGQPYGVHGVAIHQTILPGKGSAVSDGDIDADYRILSELGVTGLRFAHYQHAPHEYDLSDRAGYLVWTEVPLVSEVGESPAFAKNAAQQLRELIRQNINHPSVMVWGLGNEIYKVDETSARLLDAMQALAHQEDPSRPTAYANCCSEIDGPQASHTDAIASNVYYGWYDGEAAQLGPWLDANHARRSATPEAISEYGAGGSIFHQEDPPQRPKTTAHWHPEQYQALVHEADWRQIRDRPWLWASFIWVGFDFPSAGRNEGDRVGFNDKGLVTFDRKNRKDAWYWYQANWSATPMVYITSRRDIMRTQPDAVVKVYSNQTSVRLSLNGIDLGEQPVVDHIATWPVTLAPGRNRIEVHAGAKSDTVDWVYQGP